MVAKPKTQGILVQAENMQDLHSQVNREVVLADRLARLESGQDKLIEKIDGLADLIRDLEPRTRANEASINQAKGGWLATRVAITIIGIVSGFIGALATKLFK